jgi:hypothetical protein
VLAGVLAVLVILPLLTPLHAGCSKALVVAIPMPRVVSATTMLQ